jgi:hypothetical protein
LRTLNIALLGAFVLAQAASAGIITYETEMLGSLESPPNASPGIGFAIVTINTVAQTMEVNVSFSGLLGPSTGAHIHCCNASPGTGTSGVATTVPAFPGFPLGGTSGNYDMVLDLTSAGTYNPAFVSAQGSLSNAEAALLAGLAADKTYLNIHTTVVPGGEIRGFLVATPEPATILMAGAALAGLAILRRKRAA